MNQASIGTRGNEKDTPAVDQAERKIAGVLHDLEEETNGEVKDIELEDVVDTDNTGRPVVKRAVDVKIQQNSKRGWAR